MNFKTIVIMVCIMGSAYNMVTDEEQAALDAKFEALSGQTEKITIVNAPLLLIGQGPIPAIIVGITDIIANCQTKLSIPEDATYDFPKLCDLTDKLVGKSGLTTHAPMIAQPVATVLRQLEATVDGSMSKNLDLAKAEDKDSVNQKASKYDACLEMAISAFDSVPA